MEQDTNKLIEEQFKTLPVPLQRAITLTPWRNLVSEVAKGNNLNADQSQNLETEAMLVMYGFESPDDFAGNLARELVIDDGRAGMIAKDVEDKVFSVVIAKANELMQEKAGETLQTVPEQRPATQEIAPQVVIESKPPIPSAQTPVSKPTNLIPPAPPAQKPVNLLPMKPVNPAQSKPAGIVEQKLSQVVAQPPRVTSYPDGKDPYREPIQ